jgi:isopenicillin N synthase-like dioxygenase
MSSIEYLSLDQNGIVVLDYEDLIKEKNLSESIEEAFGFYGLGLLVVKNVPNVIQLRQNLLPLAHKFANLPEEIKNKSVHRESTYSFGWSHGKEMLEGKPDFSKGSYYNNPIYDEPFTDKELIQKYPSFCHPNIWPKEDLPELESAFKSLGSLIVEVGLLIAKQCDQYIKKKCSSYPENKLFNIIKNSKTSKARLLHYFPIDNIEEKINEENKEENYSSWCGWHNDHGSLTGLVSAMYISKDGKTIPNPDPKSGLYIRSRSGKLVQAKVPPEYLIYQIGETAQIHSGGILQATPHCVRGAQGVNSIGVSRDTFAVFMEPMWDEKMNIPEGTNIENVQKGSSSKYLPPGVPLLANRWNPNMNFGEFTEITLKSYY